MKIYMFILWNCCLPIVDFETTGVHENLVMMNFMKMRTFYKKLPLFVKNTPGVGRPTTHQVPNGCDVISVFHEILLETT